MLDKLGFTFANIKGWILRNGFHNICNGDLGTIQKVHVILRI